MVRSKRSEKQLLQQERRPCQAAKIGAVLLALEDVIHRAERCRQKLKRFGFSQRRWQEIVNDVEPDLRFLVRPKILDTIINYLHGTGKPMKREVLVRQLTAQGAGHPRRIRQSITNNLRNRNLALYSKSEIGLPEWKKRADARKK
jgi:hypothetical protein